VEVPVEAETAVAIAIAAPVEATGSGHVKVVENTPVVDTVERGGVRIPHRESPPSQARLPAVAKISKMKKKSLDTPTINGRYLSRSLS
jgi:hypothetical protein